MANTPQAKKRAKQGEIRRQRNVAHRSRLRTFVKKVRLALLAKNLEQASAAFKEAVPIIDSMVNKGIIHRNKAARDKSRLVARLKELQQAV